MAKHGERKFRSVRRKKRKGFCGTTGSKKRPKLTKEPDQDGLAGSKLEVSDNSDASESEELPMEVNVSASKLQNSSFSMYEEQEGILTRKKSINVGLGVPSVNCDNIASGYKIQDATLLRDCIASAAICSFCRKSQSTLQLFQRDYQREGLAECLFLRCSNCHHETELKTSKRLGGVGGGAHEVNRRSVLASQKLGQAGLADFCARMNFCPPVTKKSYNDHLIQIEKAASVKYRTQRKILRAKQKSKGEVSYSSGAFGLDSKPEISVKQGIKNIKSKKHIQELPSTSREQTVEIKYVEPIFEVVVTPKE